MKANRSLLVAFLFSIAFLFSSCADKDDNSKGGTENTENESINEWIYKEMSQNYFWNENIPSRSNLNFDDKPNDFFYKTLYKYNVVDRFSYIENDGVIESSDNQSTSSRTITNEIGFEFQAFIDDKGVIDFLVTYIKKNTEAEKQGLVRGDWITAVDGVGMNENNWRSILLTGKASYVLTLKGNKTLTLKATATHDENPIHTYKIITVGSTRVGYVLYNFFANGKDNNSYDYAIEMNNEVLKSFEGNIDELILDLRYNGGGLVQSGTYIASAIASNIGSNRTSKIYTRRNYNNLLEKIAAYNKSKNNYFYDAITAGSEKHIIPQLNIKRLYVITSQQTASASEQIINGLRAYMTVEVVGETTVGKNMESFSIVGKDAASKWELHPLTSVSYRSDLEAKDNDYSKGFAPTVGWEVGDVSLNYENDEFQTLREDGKFYDLGDPNESLLAKTLENISGIKKMKSRKAKESIPLRSVGSSIDRKPSLMIIENQK